MLSISAARKGNQHGDRPGFQQRPRDARQRSRMVGVLLILVSLSVLVAVVSVIALGTLVIFAPVEEPVSPRRKLVVDIYAVAAQIDDYVPETSRETWLRHRYFDGSSDIEYTYARDKHNDLYVHSTLAVTAAPAEAEKVFRRRWGLGPWSKTLPGGKDVALVGATTSSAGATNRGWV